MNLRHVRLISTYSTRFAIRSGVGLVFIMISLLFGLMVANIVMQPAEMTSKSLRKEGVERSTEEVIADFKEMPMVRDSVSWMLGGREVEDIDDEEERMDFEDFYENWTVHLLDDHPALLSTILLILLFGWPIVTSLGAFNLFSSDIQNRGLRFHLIRADRSSIFWGRALGNFLAQSVVIVVLMLTIVLYMGSKLPAYGWGPLFAWGAYGVLALIIVSLPYIALCSWISASIDSPIASLAIVALILVGVPLFSFLGRASWQPLAYINYALPWSTQNYLFHPGAGYTLGAAAACLGYTAVFCFLGHRKFTTRDL